MIDFLTTALMQQPRRVGKPLRDDLAPAAYAEVVSVAATDDDDRRASFSNANADVEVAAPGVNTLSTWNDADNGYRSISGTSMATPHVAGVAAIDDLGAPGRDPVFGFGRVNLAKAATG